jgi:hypothetical protein
MQEMYKWDGNLEQWGRRFTELQLLYSASERPGLIVFSRGSELVAIGCAINSRGYPALLFRAPFDVLDAAVFEHLPSHQLNVVRIQDAFGRVRYRMHDFVFDEALCTIVIRKMSDTLTELYFDIEDRTPPNVVQPPYVLKEFLFRLFDDRARIDRLEDHGKRDQPQFPAFSDSASQRSGMKGGRPRNIDDDWAWEQVNIHNRATKEVFPEWQEHNDKKGRYLVDEVRSFRHAINPGRIMRRKRRKPE